jgi:hypothetical protein
MVWLDGDELSLAPARGGLRVWRDAQHGGGTKAPSANGRAQSSLALLIPFLHLNRHPQNNTIWIMITTKAGNQKK